MSLQIQRKFIADNAIDSEKLLLSSGQAIRVTSPSGEVRLIELDPVSGKVKVNGEEVALSAELTAEINRAIEAEGQLAADIASEVSARQSAVSTLTTNLATEVSDRIAGDAATLVSAKAYTNEKVADLVASAPAVLDTLKELADALGGDAEFASTVAGQIGEANAAVEAEELRAMAAEGVLQGAIDAEELRAMGVEAGLQSAIEAVEEDLAQEVSDRIAAVAAVQAEVNAAELAIGAEQARAEEAEEFLQSQIDALTGGGSSGSGSVNLSSLNARLDVLEGEETVEGSVAKAEADAKAHADAAVLVEKTRAEGAEAALSAAISAEQSARQSADSALSVRVAAIEGSGEGSVAKAEADAKAYADEKIAELVNSAPAVLDTLKELSDALGGDQNFAATVAGQIGDVSDAVDAEEARALLAEGALQTAINTEISDRVAAVLAEKNRAEAAEGELAADIAQEILDRAAAITAVSTAMQAVVQAEAEARVADVNTEEARAIAAESALDGRLDVIEARAFYKMKFVLTAQDLANGYIELGHEAMPSSIVASVGRLMIHEGSAEDYTVSVVAGKTQMAFVGNLVHPSEEELAVGDVVFVRYMA